MTVGCGFVGTMTGGWISDWHALGQTERVATHGGRIREGLGGPSIVRRQCLFKLERRRFEQGRS